MSSSACCATLIGVFRDTGSLIPGSLTMPTFDPWTGSEGEPVDAHDIAHLMLNALEGSCGPSTSAVFAVLRDTQTVEREGFHLASVSAHEFADEVLRAVGHPAEERE